MEIAGSILQSVFNKISYMLKHFKPPIKKRGLYSKWPVVVVNVIKIVNISIAVRYMCRIELLNPNLS